MKVIRTKLPGCVVIEPAVFGDERGFFYEGWNAARFAEHDLPSHFVQHNVSRSQRGVLRGLHYQTSQVQGKLVRVVAGEVFDVAVDMRRSSPRFGQWAGATLAASNHRMLWIPPGFAHGFYVTGESAEFVYKCTDFYAPEHEISIRWDDPGLAIDWPLVDGVAPTLSAKDASGLCFADAPAL